MSDEIENREDAHLKAAAPELLTALKTIVSASDDGWTDWLEPLLPAARAAIAKAEGRQPSPSAGTPSP
jgi:hypothetical protein